MNASFVKLTNNSSLHVKDYFNLVGNLGINPYHILLKIGSNMTEFDCSELLDDVKKKKKLSVFCIKNIIINII
jgi:hypothetical protein